MNNKEARRVIESLSLGLPPTGYVRDFTVGRKDEIDKLDSIIAKGTPMSLLLKANPGSGKSHLLKYIRELALANNYVVSLITLDASAEARFNRMDQIFGQVCRNLEIPENNHISIRHLFNAIQDIQLGNSECMSSKSDLFFILSNKGKWSHKSLLSSDALYVAVRAWVFGNDSLHDDIEDWLFFNWNYKAQRKKLYNKFVANFGYRFSDRRSEKQFYINDVFNFTVKGYSQSWEALDDLVKLSMVAGYNGFILLVDEFEDVISNLKNIEFQRAAFSNLFDFFQADAFRGLSFFSVTPDFVHKCKNVLRNKQVANYPYSLFDQLDSFELSPLTEYQLLELGRKIVPVHRQAYNWNSPSKTVDSMLKRTCKEGMRMPMQDRVRYTIKTIVKNLNDLM